MAVAASRGHRAAARRRRQQVLLFLVGAVVVTGVAAFGMGVRSFLVVNLIADALLVGYCYVLVQVRRAQEAQRASAYRWSSAA
jgi:heme A synthase